MIDVIKQKYNSFIANLKAKVRLIKLESYTLANVYRHKQTPWYAKLSIIITLGYLLSPIDLIPDFIPILGYLDDLIIVPILILFSIKLIPTDILEQCRQQAQEQLSTNQNKRKKTAWWFGLLIVLFYIMMLSYLITWLIKKFSN